MYENLTLNVVAENVLDIPLIYNYCVLTGIITYTMLLLYTVYFTESWFSKQSMFEALDLEVSERQLQSLYDTVVSDNDILSSGLKFDVCLFIKKCNHFLGKATKNILQLQAMLGIKEDDHLKTNDKLMGTEQAGMNE